MEEAKRKGPQKGIQKGPRGTNGHPPIRGILSGFTKPFSRVKSATGNWSGSVDSKVQEILEEGILDCVQKPFTYEQLQKKTS